VTNTQQRALALVTICELAPPILRDGLLADERLRDQFDLKVDPELDLGPPWGSFKASKILQAVCTAAEKRGAVASLSNTAGTQYMVTARVSRLKASLIISGPKLKVTADHFLLLTKNKSARQQVFLQQLEGNSCAEEITQQWSALIARRPLSHRELGMLAEDLGRTPAVMASAIQAQLRQQQLPIDAIVPQSLEYYERLIGRLRGQKNISEYVEQVLTKHIHALLEWDETEGLRAALLLGAHSMVSDVLAKELMSPGAFAKLVQWAKAADPLTQTAVLEMALARSGSVAQFAADVRLLAEGFCERQESNDAFAVLSAVFHLVDGDLGKRRLMTTRPPFWRRLAALAHSALITRGLIANGIVPSEMIESMDSARITEFQMQGIVDMRTEPRWQGDFSSPYQFKNELGGRVFGAASRNVKAAEKLGLRDLLLGDAAGGLKSAINLTSAQLPGPLEGNVEPIQKLPEEILQKMRESLSDPALSLLSFALVSNTSLFVNLPEDVLQLAGDAVRRANYHLDPQGKPEWVETCLVNMATAAAVNRNARLADEMFIILRSYRRLFRGELSLDAAIRVGLISCASRSDLRDWCQCVGALMNDLAFGDLERGEARALYELTTTLCDLVPELWVTCGQGIAAVEAVSWG
jgi:hypothetical protein